MVPLLWSLCTAKGPFTGSFHYPDGPFKQRKDQTKGTNIKGPSATAFLARSDSEYQPDGGSVHRAVSNRHLADGICQKAFSRLKTPFGVCTWRFWPLKRLLADAFLGRHLSTVCGVPSSDQPRSSVRGGVVRWRGLLNRGRCRRGACGLGTHRA